MQEYDLYNTDEYPLALPHASFHLFTDLPGSSSEAIFNSGLETTHPDVLEPYLNAQEKFQITKPSSLLPGSQAPSEVPEKKADVSHFINKQMKQEGFGEESLSQKIKIDPDIVRAMQNASVGIARIKSSDRFVPSGASGSSTSNKKDINKQRLDNRDKFKFI